VSDIDTVLVDSLKALDPNGRLEKRTSHAHFEFAEFDSKRTMQF
jgi:hypothetical protein